MLFGHCAAAVFKIANPYLVPCFVNFAVNYVDPNHIENLGVNLVECSYRQRSP